MALSIRYHPEHLAYFNEWAGGPIEGRQHLVDSNLDWGQNLYQLADWLEDHPSPQLGLAYFGSFPPGELGIRYEVPPGRFPKPGRYAVSVNFVQGRPHTAAGLMEATCLSG